MVSWADILRLTSVWQVRTRTCVLAGPPREHTRPCRSPHDLCCIGVLQVQVGLWVNVLVLGSGGIEEWPGQVMHEWDELDTDKSLRRICTIWHPIGPYGSPHTSTYVKGRVNIKRASGAGGGPHVHSATKRERVRPTAEARRASCSRSKRHEVNAWERNCRPRLGSAGQG